MLNTLLEKNLLPDFIVRIGIRRLLKQRLIDEKRSSPDMQSEYLAGYIEQLRLSPIAVETTAANEQHYEVPTDFFKHVLGKHLKYSSGYWHDGISSLDIAEQNMLELTVRRAELRDGMSILELGCGWGSLSLFMAENFPKSTITAVSNSRTQKLSIDEQAQKRGFHNIRVITSDMNEFRIDEQFDRIVSVEMFEHMRNYAKLLEKVAAYLKRNGKLFVHIFTHKTYAYLFEDRDPSDWMAKYFFTGGQMPSDHLLFYFNEHVRIEKHWQVSGTHYAKTAEAWLRNMDDHRSEIMPILEKTYGKEASIKWWVYWRVFFMACAELWGYRNGEEWLVSHYLFNKNNSL